MKVLKDQNNTMVNAEKVNNKTNVGNDDVREKIKILIKKKNYNLRDLSRNIKKMMLICSNISIEELPKFFLKNIGIY